MPGVLMENGATETGDVTMTDATHTNHPPMKPPGINGVAPEDVPRDAPTTNGEPATRNGAAAEGGLLQSAVGDQAAGTDLTSTRPSSPPYIKRVEIEDYKDLAVLITRITQETFNNLAEVIQSMADRSANDPSAGHDGGKALTNGNAGGQSEASAWKKQRLMDFVQHRKAQFIKLLVLVQWSRQTDEVRVAIDLLQWLRGQLGLQDEACLELGRLKLALGPAKLPNPDLITALDVLSTGQVPRKSNLDYIPLEPVTPQQMLKTLRDLNILLSIRLHLHEELPPFFRTFTIASGRATFVVPEEFEVDLSVADEDPTSQFYLIDFRLIFAPAEGDLMDEMKERIEAQANEVLRTGGLAGCYEFLHEFVLTHKINILRRQAAEASRARWTESIRLETVRRSFVVHYWPNRPGGKSWIEIGIQSGKKHAERNPVTGQSQYTSRIAVQWTRDGKEVKDPPIKIDLGNLSFEAILQHVVALHSNHFLRAIRDRLLPAPLYKNRVLRLALTTSKRDSVLSSMRMQLTACRTAKLTIEPVDGRFALQPPSLRFSQTENTLNSLRDPAADAYGHLSNLRCLIAKEEIEHRAQTVGWQQLKTLKPRPEDLKRVFPRETLQVSYFTRKGWSLDWILAVSISMAGEVWWIIEMLPAHVGYTFGDHRPVPITSPANKALDPSYQFFSRLEQAATGLISQYISNRSLGTQTVDHSFSPAKDPDPPSASSPSINLRGGDHLASLLPPSLPPIAIPTLLIRFSSLMKHPASHSSSSSSSSTSTPRQPWAKELIKVTYQPSTPPDGHYTLITEARLTNPKLLSSITSPIDEDIELHPPSGALAFRLRAQIGRPLIAEIQDRLRRIERLIMFLGALKTLNLGIASMSLGRIVFTYSPPASSSRSSPVAAADVASITAEAEAKKRREATLTFDGPGPVSLLFPPGNPHVRIKDFLVKILNTDWAQGLERVAMLMLVTLPLLGAFDHIESLSSGSSASLAGSGSASGSASGAASGSGPGSSQGAEVSILPHSPTAFLLRYLIPRPASAPASSAQAAKAQPQQQQQPPDLVFSIRLRPRRDEMKWFVALTSLHPTTAASAANMTPLALMEAGGLATERRERMRVLMDGKGADWEGLRTGMVAGRAGVGEVVRRVDAIVRGDAGSTG